MSLSFLRPTMRYGVLKARGLLQNEAVMTTQKKSTHLAVVRSRPCWMTTSSTGSSSYIINDASETTTSSSSTLVPSSSGITDDPSLDDSLSTPVDSSSNNNPIKNDSETEIRLSKWIAQHHGGGVSRREVERWIREGRVRVHDAVVDSSAAILSPQNIHRVTVNGRLLNTRTSTGSGNSLLNDTLESITSSSSSLVSSSSGIAVERQISSSRSLASPLTHSYSFNDPAIKEGSPDTEIRLSKLIARQCGVSRREAERWIREGNVRVHDEIVNASAATVAPQNIHSVTVHGKRVKAPAPGTGSAGPKIRTRVWMVHKLDGEIVTENDPKNRPTLMERLIMGGVGKSKKHKHTRREHLKPVGRLDMPTTGLILVTNDGQYARDLEKSNLHRVYLARVHGRVAQYKLDAMARSLVIENIRYHPMKVELAKTRKRADATNQWLNVTCTQGKNRQVRKILQHFGLTVTRLMRLSYGDYRLEKLPLGMVLEVPPIPVNKHQQCGPLFAKSRRASTKTSTNKDDEGDQSESPKAVQWVRSVPS